MASCQPQPEGGDSAEIPQSRFANHQQYDVTPDDERFLMALRARDHTAVLNTTVLVQNFFEELKARVPN